MVRASISHAIDPQPSFACTGSKEYLVLWQNFPEEAATWEPEENLMCDEVMEKFNKHQARDAKKAAKKASKKKRKSSEDGVQEQDSDEPPRKRRRRDGKKSSRKKDRELENE